MKKGLKFLSIICLMFCSILFFTACDENTETVSSEKPELIGLVELRASGYKNEITVGEDFAPKGIRVERKSGDSWRGVLKDTYVIECDYDGTTYGEFDLNIYLKADRRNSIHDIIKVNPIKVEIPVFSTQYTGEMVDIKSELEEESEGLYNVVRYVNNSNVGTYDILLKLTNPSKYAWVDSDNNVLTYPTTEATWSITKASSQPYTGQTSFEVQKGKTLMEIKNDFNLSNIYFQRSEYEVINETKAEYVIYNPSRNNYEDTIVKFDFIVVDN